MEESIFNEVLDELFSSLESLETQTRALTLFLKDQNIVPADDFAPYLHKAAEASGVRWRAERVRMNSLLTSAFKKVDESIAARIDKAAAEQPTGRAKTDHAQDAEPSQSQASKAKDAKQEDSRQERSGQEEPKPAQSKPADSNNEDSRSHAGAADKGRSQEPKTITAQESKTAASTTQAEKATSDTSHPVSSSQKAEPTPAPGSQSPPSGSTEAA